MRTGCTMRGIGRRSRAEGGPQGSRPEAGGTCTTAGGPRTAWVQAQRCNQSGKEAIPGAGGQPSAAARVRLGVTGVSKSSLQAVEGEGSEGEAGIVIVGELGAAAQEAAGDADHDGKGRRGVPGPGRLHRWVGKVATMVEHGGLIRRGVAAEAGETGVHVGADAAAVAAKAYSRELEDVVGAWVGVERKLAPEGDEPGATSDGAAPPDEDAEAGPRGAELEEVGAELRPKPCEEGVELRCPRSEVR